MEGTNIPEAVSLGGGGADDQRRSLNAHTRAHDHTQSPTGIHQWNPKGDATEVAFFSRLDFGSKIEPSGDHVGELKPPPESPGEARQANALKWRT